MDAGPLVERLRRIPEADTLDHLGEFDPSNDLHVDEAARMLLARFRREQDAEAFTLLFELTQRRLREIADRIVRKLCPAADPDDLTASFMARLFADLGSRHQESVRHFLGLAHTAMRNEVLDLLRHNKRAQAGVQKYQDTLDLPRDPAEQAQRHEQDDLLTGYGHTIVRLTDECFRDLDDRDKQILVAREILGLSYDRVAAVLELAPDQVGMIIRRARERLAQRLVERLAGEADLSGDTLANTQATVLRCLGSKERTKSMRTLVQRMLERSADAGRRHLADLVYELAKACLLSVPGFEERMLVRTLPRPRDVVTGDVRHLASRLQRLSAPVDVDAITSGPPAGSSALADAEACLDVLARLEGHSGRRLVALALHHIYGERLEEAEAILRPLIEVDLPPVTRQNVFRNLTLTLLRQERHAEALALTDAAADEWPDDPARLMNACFAAARLGEVVRFEESARHLLAQHARQPTPRVSAWVERMLPDLANAAGVSRERLAALFGDVENAGDERHQGEHPPEGESRP